MRPLSHLLTVATLLVAATVAFADTELVLLSDGTNGMADVISTTEDSITVKFETADGTAGETVLRASRLDSHTFYGLRSKYMEKTPENHVKLALYCAELGMFHRAKREMDEARKLDPDVDKKIDTLPGVAEGIAQRLADAAKRAYDKGDLKLAYELAQLIATRFTETPLAAKALDALDKIEAKMADEETAETSAREKKITDATDVATRELEETRNNLLVPIEKQQEAGRKQNAMGLRANNRSTAKRYFESAASEFERALRAAEAVRKRGNDDSELNAMVDDLATELKSDGVNAWINAGNIELWRENYNGAEKAAKKALEIDPDSMAARSFLSRVSLANSSGSDDVIRRGPIPPRPTPHK